MVKLLGWERDPQLQRPYALAFCWTCNNNNPGKATGMFEDEDSDQLHKILDAAYKHIEKYPDHDVEVTMEGTWKVRP